MKLRLEKPEREAIGARLRKVRRFNQLEQTELAQRAGLSQAIISQYEKGLTEVSLSFIKFLADNFGISGDWLIFGASGSPYEKKQKEVEVQLAEGGGKTSARRGRKKERFCRIPLVDPKSAATPGAVHTDRVTEWELVRVEETAGRENLVALDIKADWVKNMNPPFRPGSRVIIDRDDKKVSPDAYYAVHAGAPKKKGSREASVNAIRRLSLSGQRLWFVEDRPRGEFDYVDIKSAEALDRHIIGRIIWVWQKLV